MGEIVANFGGNLGQIQQICSIGLGLAHDLVLIRWLGCNLLAFSIVPSPRHGDAETQEDGKTNGEANN